MDEFMQGTRELVFNLELRAFPAGTINILIYVQEYMFTFCL